MKQNKEEEVCCVAEYTEFHNHQDL